MTVFNKLGVADCCDGDDEEFEDVEGDEEEEETETGEQDTEDDTAGEEEGPDFEASSVNDKAAAVDSEMDEEGVPLPQLIEKCGGADALFPPLDGTAFYLTTCKINHSCDPNVFVRYTTTLEDGLVAELVTLRDIPEGEELVQSYIDQSLSTTERQRALADYGFRCQCHRCKA